MGPGLPFPDDDRGVSTVIGFIFVFAILMILLSVNQAQVVPAENEQVEFQHFQEVRDDLVEVHAAISTAGQTDVSQFPTVKLGTDYPPRVLAVNPPRATGNLRTSEAYNITITDETDTTVEVPTRFIEYRPNYWEFQSGSTWYENSVLYLDESERGGIVIIEEQNLITDNNTVRITALQNDFQRSGVSQVTIELYPTEAGNLSDLTGQLDIKIPTQIDDYWNNSLAGKDQFEQVNLNEYGSGVHELNLTVEKENLEINTVGIQEEPEELSAKQNVGIPSDQPPTSTGTGQGIVFTDSQANLKSVVNGSTIIDYNYGQTRVIGPKVASLDRDDTIDVPLVNHQRDVLLVDENGNTAEAATNGNKQKSVLAVGQWTNSDISVLYATKSGEIWRANANSNGVEIDPLDGNANANAVIGVGDIDGDTKNELIFAGNGPGGNSDTVNFIDEDSTIKNIEGSSYGVNNAPGVGHPADFDGDGTFSVPIVDGSNNIKLLDATGTLVTYSMVSASKSPVASSDVDGDGVAEIAYIADDGYIKFIDNVRTGSEQVSYIVDDAGNKVTASTKRGIA